MPQPFSGRDSRYKCPHCGKDQAFTRYILRSDYEQGKITYAGEDYGMCNHKSKCGYLKYPDGKETMMAPMEIKPEQPKYFYDRRSVALYYQLGAWEKSTLMQYLLQHIDRIELERIAKEYCVGCLPDATVLIDEETKEYRKYYNGSIFWQVDEKGEIHRGKVMFYREDGHREKHPNDTKRGIIKMMWQILRRKRENEPDMCYFGQHLIKKYPYRPIAIVESEKTAIVAACCMQQFTWLACGGLNFLTAERLNFIRGTNLPIVIYPDYDGFPKWKQRIDELAPLFPKNVFEINESILTHGNGKQDIADILLSD